MSNEQRFTEAYQCRHCRNKAPMEIVGGYSGLREYCDERSGITWDAGYVYQIDCCPACSGITLRRYGWHSGSMDPSEIEYEVLYPGSHEVPRGLPEAVQKAYEAATRVRSIDANAYSVLLGRVLEIVCQDRSAKGDSLAARLRDLSSKGEIPERLSQVADGLRQLRNVGAHPSLGELTAAEVPVLDNLTRAILEYVYTAEVLVQEAENCLNRLKTKKTSDKTVRKGKTPKETS